MKPQTIAWIATVLMGSLSGVQAATSLTSWTFDNVPVGVNASPGPSTGLGTASALGMASGYNNTNSVSNPDVQSLPGSSTGSSGPQCWRIRGYSTIAGSGGNGWSTAAPIGSQGAQFNGSTFGYYQTTVSFDVYATSDAEANLQVQYSTDGSTWNNAVVTSVGSGAVILNNSVPSADTNATVVGSYVALASGWNNQITVNLSGVSGVDNDPSFAIRMVNASSGTNCVDTTGAVYNNKSGSWTFDNVVIAGASIDTIADWTFESEPNDGTIIISPVPEIGGSLVGQAYSMGFNNGYTYSGLGTGSTDASDVNNTGGSSSGAAGPNAWRLRGAYNGNPGPGWNTAAPIGTQGAEFDVDTSGYTNIVVYFDLYVTSQGEAKMCVLYTTDGWVTTNTGNSLFYGAKPAYILTNSSSATTVTGTYFYETGGQGFYNNIVLDLTGVPAAANNRHFGFRIVNAATGADCVNATGGSYNNSSGNCRLDNVTVGGTAGNPPPVVTYDPNATVDSPVTNTLPDNAAWRASITAIYDNGYLLPKAAYSTANPGEIIFTPSQSTVLQASGLHNIVITATGYGSARFAQPIAPGVATHLAVATQLAGPTASGGTLTANPVFVVADQYGNGTVNPYPNVSMTASVGGSGGWTLGGDASQSSVNGIIAFTNLTASVNGASAVSGAFVRFTVSGYPPVTVTNSPTFTIGAPPAPFTPGNLAVVQIDTLGNNTTFSVVEVRPSVAGQTSPVNIVPISASGANGLRLSSSATTGRLALSDDGTLIGFAAFADNSSATPDETYNLSRAAASLDYSGQLTIGMTYNSTSLGGSQARAACVLDDDQSWIVDDKGGLYQGSALNASLDAPNLNAFNNVVVKTFGGIPYVETQKAVSGLSIPVVYALSYDEYTGLWDGTVANNLTTDPSASDFYLVSTNAGSTYDILYINDLISSTSGVIKKYSWVGGNWIANGSFTNKTGVDGLFATTNGAGGVYLFATTGGGGTSGNSLIRLTDASAWNQNIHITTSNLLYTTAAGTSLKGLTFVPLQTPGTAELIPPPILTAQSGAAVSASFTVTNTPDVPAWRAAITSIQVNGTTLPPAAYDRTQAGKLAFDPTQSALLQTSGAKTIVISATGYSTDAVVQTLGAGPATKVVVTTQPTAPLGSGGALATQPIAKVEDLYGNVVTSSSASVAAAPVQGTWTLGGTKTKNAASGVVTFTDLTAFSAQAIAGATISFSSSGLTGATSSGFNIPAPIHSLLGGTGLSAGKFGFSFTNITGLSYSVLATNNLGAPVATWPVIGNPVESPAGSGHYQFTDPNLATNRYLFYYLRQP